MKFLSHLKTGLQEMAVKLIGTRPPKCRHPDMSIVYSSGACAVEECPHCGYQIIHGLG